MKYIDAEKLKAEIKRRKIHVYEAITADEPKYRTHYKVGKYEAFGDLLDIINSFQQEQPSLPSNLDEAAEESMPEEEGFLETDIYGGSESVYSREQMLAMFKSGAEWMADNTNSNE